MLRDIAYCDLKAQQCGWVALADQILIKNLENLTQLRKQLAMFIEEVGCLS